MFNYICPTFSPIWHAVRKVISLKQWEYYSCTCERPQYSHDLSRAEMYWLCCNVGYHAFRNRQRII